MIKANNNADVVHPSHIFFSWVILLIGAAKVAYSIQSGEPCMVI